MDVIEFKNGETSVSEETFLAFQNNIQKAFIPVLLYDGGITGTTGDVTLSEDYANFEYIEIFAGKDETGFMSVKVPKSLYGQLISVATHQLTGAAQILQIVEKQMRLIDGNVLHVIGVPGYINFNRATLGISEIGQENKINVYKVIGYRH